MWAIATRYPADGTRTWQTSLPRAPGRHAGEGTIPLSAQLDGTDPYDELPYRSLPIEWSAPERLALASLLHGGPRPSLDSYRVLELGCGNGANLLPLAYYRRHAEFVGVDGSPERYRDRGSPSRRARAGQSRVRPIELPACQREIAGLFDFIIAHGIFSWVPEQTRDALFALCANRLRPGGLLYLNYNTKPGWNVRGMVRDLLLANTAGVTSLERRVELARDVAAKLAASLEAAGDHPYTRLLENEFRFVRDSDPSYVAHEFLAADNHPYWRREFVALARRYGFEHVADADFNYSSGRIPRIYRARSRRQVFWANRPTIRSICCPTGSCTPRS